MSEVTTNIKTLSREEWARLLSFNDAVRRECGSAMFDEKLLTSLAKSAHDVREKVDELKRKLASTPEGK